MKRIKKRYTSEQEILNLIDECKAAQVLECAQAQSLDHQIELNQQRLAKYPQTWEIGYGILAQKVKDELSEKSLQIREWRKQSDKLRKHQGALATRLLPLKDKLAAFNTEPMPFLPDRSVV